MAEFPISYYKQLIEVVLVVAAVNLNGGGIAQYLVINNELPHRLLNRSETTLDLAAALLREYTSLEAKINGVGWIPLYLGGVYDTVNRVENDRVVAISYGAIIPSTTKLHLPAQWKSFQEIFEKKFLANDHMQILSTTSMSI